MIRKTTVKLIFEENEKEILKSMARTDCGGVKCSDCAASTSDGCLIDTIKGLDFTERD